METSNSEKVLKKIQQERLNKGYTYENMADELSITPAAYRKIETGKTKLTVERLFKITEILNVSVATLLEIKSDVFIQTNNENAIGNLQNFYQESKEIYEKMIQSKDEEIKFLRELVKSKK